MYRFLIYISYSYALPIGQPLENEINGRDLKVKWFADEEDGRKGLMTKKNVLNTINEVLDYNPHIVLTISDIVADFIPGLKVQIFHGFLAQKRLDRNNQFSHFRIRKFFDLYCTQGPSTTKEFERLSQIHKCFEVVETGWSKVDPLFPLEKKEFSETAVVMIASTFTEKLSIAYDQSVFNEINRLSGTGKYIFKMVLHPKIPDDVRSKWKSLENESFTFYDTTDLIPLFKQTDILFADNTSVIQEYLLQEKPVVVYNHNYEHEYLIHVHNAEDIDKSFNKALSYPKNLIASIRDFILELHPYSDGESSARVIDACISFLHADKSHLKSKPLNFIRKYKIRKRLNYFTFNSFNKPWTTKKEEIFQN